MYFHEKIFLHKYSKYQIMKYVKHTKAKIEVIPHGVNIKKLKINYNSKNFRFIYISNIDYYKNHDFIINSVNTFLNKHPQYKNKIFFEFYGSAYKPALKNMKNILNKIENKKNFKYFGLQNQKYIFKEKNQNIVSLFSSSCENFSVTLIEAMAMGIPILCIDKQPMKSVLGKNGLTYKHNSYKSLEMNLIKIINSSFIRKKYSYLAYQRSKIFTSEIIAKKTFDFLNKIASLR